MFAQSLFLAVAALIIQKPSSVIVEEGENVTLLCKASSRPTPTVTWVRALGHLPKGKTAVIDGKLTIQNVAKADSGTYACSAKNSLGKDSAFALITVTDRLKFTQTPPLKVSTVKKSNLRLNCAARGTIVIIWKRAGQSLPQNYVVYRNGTLLLRNFSPKMPGRILASQKMLIAPLRQEQLLNCWVSIKISVKIPLDIFNSTQY